MTAMPQGPWAAPPPSRWSAGRIVALVLGALLLIPALGLLIGGGALLWVDNVSRSDDGYVLSPTDTFTSDGYALRSERIDLSNGADWVPLSSSLGTARVDVTGTGPSQDVFVGIASVADATRYLDGVSGTVIDDLGFADQAQITHLLRGGPPSAPPGDQDFWITQSSGSGTQQLSWSPAQGNWMLVIMNADGSASVAVDARIGATLPALDGLAWGVLIAGIVLTLIAGLVIVLAVRRPASRTGTPYGYQPAPAAGGPQQPWTPPSGREPGIPPSSGPPSGPPPSASRQPWTPPVPVDRGTAADAAPDSARSTPPGDQRP
jgi:hypothetical protein